MSQVNVFKKLFCRVFQLGMRIALPFLPYREPKLIEGVGGVPAVLQAHNIDCVMLVTDAGVHGLGLTARLEEELKAANIRCVSTTAPWPTPPWPTWNRPGCFIWRTAARG